MPNSRRQLLKGMALTGAGLASMTPAGALALGQSEPALKGNIRHSVSRWTYGHLSVEELCKVVRQLGFAAIDLVGPEDWPTLKQYGVDSSMCNGAELNLTDGWADARYHGALIPRYLEHIDKVAEAGYTNLICFSGNTRDLTPEQGLDNAVKGLQQILPRAESRGVIIQMELLNSKINHHDYMADNTAWGVELCKRLGSPNFKLLYDIYHMQIDEGDVIRTIKDNHRYIGHYHTAGVPGRHEIGDNQELNYPAIARAIVATGFDGYLAQEFIPTPADGMGKIESLRSAVHICDV